MYKQTRPGGEVILFADVLSVMVRWWNGRAWIERHGFHHISCITRPCSAIVSHDLAEIDPVLTAVLLAALIVALACRRQTKRRPWMHLLLAHVVITILLLLRPPRQLLRAWFVPRGAIQRCGAKR